MNFHLPTNQEFLLQNKFDLRINESSDENPIFKSSNMAKRVHFASSPIIYRSVPWLTESNNYQTSAGFEAISILEQNQLIYENSLKNDFTQLRTPYNKSQQMTLFGFIIIIFCFIFLFSLIWWIAEKLLLIEIEQQLSNTLNRYNAAV